MKSLFITFSRALKKITGHRRHFGYQIDMAGHLVDSSPDDE
jgi:hypothetical protein